MPKIKQTKAEFRYFLSPDVKRRAMAKAKSEGRPLTFILDRLLGAWADGDIPLPEPKQARPTK